MSTATRTPFQNRRAGAATSLGRNDARAAGPGGVYCEDCSVKGVVPDDHADLSTGGVKAWAIDVDAAERLWAVSVAATGLDPLG